MMFLSRVSLSFLIVSLLLINSAWAQSAPSSDEAAVRALTEAYFQAWATKDRTAFVQLWQSQAPEFAPRLQGMTGFFASRDPLVMHSLTVRRVKVESDKAWVRVAIEAQLPATQIHPEKSRTKMLRALEYVREAGQWKVWREVAAAADLASALIAAQNEPERAALLAAESELVTAELVHELNTQGNRRPVTQAIVINQLAARLGEQIGDKFGTARSLSNVGSLFQTQGNIGQALTFYQQSLALLVALERKDGIANNSLIIGNLHRLQGNYAQAITSYQQSLTTYEALQDKLGKTRVLNNLGLAHLFQGDVAPALESTQQALTLAEALSNKVEMAASLYNLGRIHLDQSNYAQALIHFQQSLTIRERLNARAAVADTLLRIGNVQQAQGNYAQALTNQRQSLAISEALADKPTMARTLTSLGDVYLSQNNYAAALTYLQKSLALSEAMQAKAIVASTLNSIGVIHRLQGNGAQALEYHRQSLAIFEVMEDKPGIAAMVNNIGIVYQAQGDYARALEHFTRSGQMWKALEKKNGTVSSLNNIGRVYFAQGNYEKALEYQQQALVLGESLGAKAGLVRLLSNLAEIYEKQQKHAQALEVTQRAATLAQEVGETDTLMKIRFTAGLAHRALKQTSQARAAFTEAIALIETLRTQVAGGEEEQQRFFATRVSPYHAMVDLLNAEGSPVEALRFAEYAKSRVLLDVLQTGRVNITKALTGPEQEQEHKLRAEVIAINNQISRSSQMAQPDPNKLNELKTRRTKARLTHEAFQTSLYAAHPELKVQRGEATIIKAEELAALLPDAASALLEYVVTDDRTYLFAVTKAADQSATVQTFTLPIKREELNQQIEAFRQQLAGRDLGFRAASARLYDLLLKPAQAQLKGKTNLIIVPDDKLWELPFQALQLGPTGAPRFLVEDAAIAYTPSLTVLREMMQRRKPSTTGATLLALGNPALGSETLARAALTLRDGKLASLPAAEEEVKALGQLYTATHSKVYVGTEAREDRAKAEAATMRILHFATHGILNNATPMYSHLMLTPGTTDEDGLLEAWELMQMDLQADLAVLSACETARGRYGAGEGMIGLSWALFVAGVPSTVVSQWKVESASTRDLMLQFHRGLQTGKASKAEALRQSALSLLRNPATNHPFYWAGFVLIGDQR